ncbi:MAG: calcium/sodium antiporter [Nitrospinota bacterium]
MESFFQGLPLWLNVVLFLVGLIMVTGGAGWFTDGAVGIAEATGVPKMVVGATVVSFATTSPEFSVSWIAAVLSRPATSVGNALGSTICNIGLIAAVAALIRPVRIPRSVVRPQGVAMWAAGAVLVALSWNGVLGRLEGYLLLAGTGLYLWYSARHSGWGRGTRSESSSPHRWGPVLGWFLWGALAVVGGSVLLVQNAVPLARAMGVPELVVALTFVAVGTSLPELSTAIASSRRGHGDISVGNVMGANILNIVLVLGGSAAILPLKIESQTFLLDFPAMGLMMVLFVAVAAFWGRVGRLAGGLFLSAYALYLGLMVAFFI